MHGDESNNKNNNNNNKREFDGLLSTGHKLDRLAATSSIGLLRGRGSDNSKLTCAEEA
jgi:hypothetical protein